MPAVILAIVLVLLQEAPLEGRHCGGNALHRDLDANRSKGIPLRTHRRQVELIDEMVIPKKNNQIVNARVISL